MPLDDAGAPAPSSPLAFTIKVALATGLAAFALTHHPAHRRTGPVEPKVTG